MLVGKWPLKPYEERLSQYLFSHRFTLFFSQLQVNVARAIDILSDGLRFQKENYIIQISYLTLRPKNLQFEPSRDPLPSLLVVSFLLWWKWIYVSMWATTHPPVPSPNMNPNISVDCCQVGGGEGRFTTVQILTLIHENITMFETKFSTFQYAVTSFFKMSKVANLIRTNFGGDNMVPIHLCSITQPSFAHKMFATFWFKGAPFIKEEKGTSRCFELLVKCILHPSRFTEI